MFEYFPHTVKASSTDDLQVWKFSWPLSFSTVLRRLLDVAVAPGLITFVGIVWGICEKEWVYAQFLGESLSHALFEFKFLLVRFSVHFNRMQPRTLEALVFLNQNRRLWNLALVSTVVNEKPDEDISDDEDTDDGDE